jgi:CDP-diacylglycerol--glycerol-3-phosphate 3-phosphatidyltransferase
MIRVSLIPIFLGILYTGIPYKHYIAAAVFVLAAMTDIIDGHIARSMGQITDFGKLIDPLADKLLVFAAMLWFVGAGTFPVWAALIVIIREFLVTGIRMVASIKGNVIAASLLGKMKTLITMIVLPFMFLPLAQPFDMWLDWAQISPWLNRVCVILIVVTTTVSGVDYVIKNRDLLDWKN